MMHLSNEEMTSFITKKGTYCYSIMPLGLKNVGPTYQRMVNKVFKDLLSNTMKACIDDMIVKSSKLSPMLKNLLRVFQVLKQYNMRLNHNKCSFKGLICKILVAHDHKPRIDYNPKKIKNYPRYETTYFN